MTGKQLDARGLICPLHSKSFLPWVYFRSPLHLLKKSHWASSYIFPEHGWLCISVLHDFLSGYGRSNQLKAELNMKFVMVLVKTKISWQHQMSWLGFEQMVSDEVTLNEIDYIVAQIKSELHCRMVHAWIHTYIFSLLQKCAAHYLKHW